VSGDADGGAPSDAAVEDGSDGGIVAACGTIGVFRDDFSSDQFSTRFFSWGDSIVRSNGTISFTPENYAGAWEGVWGRRKADMTGASLSIEIPAMLSTTTDVSFFFDIEHRDQRDEFSIFQQNGRLYFYDADQGQSIDIGYDPGQHRWWRVRDAGSTVEFETSPDGNNWTSHWDRPTPAWITLVAPVFGTWEPGSATGAGTVVADNLNINSTDVDWCMVDSIVEDFEDGMIGIEWRAGSTDTSRCAPSESGGAAVFTHTGSGTEGCYYVGRSGYKFENGEVVFELAPLTLADKTYAYVAVEGAEARVAQIEVREGTVCGLLKWSNNTPIDSTCATYDTSHVFWRLQESGGVVSMATSPDSITWTPLHNSMNRFVSEQVSLFFGIGTDSGTSASTVSFLAINP